MSAHKRSKSANNSFGAKRAKTSKMKTNELESPLTPNFHSVHEEHHHLSQQEKMVIQLGQHCDNQLFDDPARFA